MQDLLERLIIMILEFMTIFGGLYLNRKSGVLLHISSLPGPFCIGDFGSIAERFADFLVEAGFSTWQVLPVTPVCSAFGNSPYSSPSAFAGNFLFISPEKMILDGLIDEEDVNPFFRDSLTKADYAYAAHAKHALLVKAWGRFRSEDKKYHAMREEIQNFREKESRWLDDYALFTVLKGHFAETCWNEWPKEFRNRDNYTLRSFVSQTDNAAAIDFVVFVQFIFYRQWKSLHEYCRTKGVSLMGDIPMFVALDSSDVWANQEFFDLDEDSRPNCVAGVPPDYFSRTGQKWGNPLYKWDRMENDGFSWWILRIRHAFKIFDSVRIDHFRGFCGYWAIPASDKTAQNGEWLPAPGKVFFEILTRDTEADGNIKLQLIAEDLGIITDDVRALMDEFALPGMKVLLFAFCEDIGTNPYAPHNIVTNSVVYTGTHDNNTVNGWWKNETSEEDRMRFKAYVGYDVQLKDAAGQMMLLALSSVAELAVIPMQDILGLDETCRMNTPGKRDGNWVWRLTFEEFAMISAEGSSFVRQLREINIMYGRHKRI